MNNHLQTRESLQPRPFSPKSPFWALVRKDAAKNGTALAPIICKVDRQRRDANAIRKAARAVTRVRNPAAPAAVPVEDAQRVQGHDQVVANHTAPTDTQRRKPYKEGSLKELVDLYARNKLFTTEGLNGTVTMFCWVESRKAVRARESGITKQNPFVPIVQYDRFTRRMCVVALLWPREDVEEVPNGANVAATLANVPFPSNINTKFWCAWTNHALLRTPIFEHNDERFGHIDLDELNRLFCFIDQQVDDKTLAGEILVHWPHLCSSRSARAYTEIVFPGRKSCPTILLAAPRNNIGRVELPIPPREDIDHDAYFNFEQPSKFWSVSVLEWYLGKFSNGNKKESLLNELVRLAQQDADRRAVQKARERPLLVEAPASKRTKIWDDDEEI